MAKETKSAGDDFGEDPLVTALVPDPSRVPLLQVLRGFHGRAVDDARLRIYLTADLSRYVEVDRGHVRLIRAMPNDEGSSIWIETEAPMVRVDLRPTRAGAAYLEGPIAEHPTLQSQLSTGDPTSTPITWGGYLDIEGRIAAGTKCAICRTR